ncbi:hypothetical protein HHL19_16520 [Streptomyces sp. R302]|uniref:hypothetical protein n=1 Tax=unclassified Streptomyces TaxID=2593676 RepID=UPI00145F3165|nr:MULTISPECIES: hypothetical protein [unclassified Streptomyces]NML55374.1 hypothetical protein [Streptomyces sp. R301]NML80246.1 hypothetical protein [Streptomyces sp. R302]
MTGPVRSYLPQTPYAVLTVDETWCAMTVPLDWAGLMAAALGDEAGPIFADAGLNLATVFLPSGAGEDWPDLSGAAVQWHRAGASLLVPGPEGCASMSWLRWPLDDVPVFTDPSDLRTILERLLGPLETASALGPIAVCSICNAPSRDVKVIAWGEQMSGPGWSKYACALCRDVPDLRDALEDL